MIEFGANQTIEIGVLLSNTLKTLGGLAIVATIVHSLGHIAIVWIKGK